MHKSDEKQLDQPHAQDGNVQKQSVLIHVAMLF